MSRIKKILLWIILFPVSIVGGFLFLYLVLLLSQGIFSAPWMIYIDYIFAPPLFMLGFGSIIQKLAPVKNKDAFALKSVVCFSCFLLFLSIFSLIFFYKQNEFEIKYLFNFLGNTLVFICSIKFLKDKKTFS